MNKDMGKKETTVHDGSDGDDRASRRELLKEKTHGETTVHGHKMSTADVFKFVGLIAFFAIMILVCVLLWPYIHELFEPGGIDRVIEDVQNAGLVGFFILLAIQFLQIVVAFIPGEVVQVAAGMIYGPWVGALVVLVGCVISSAFIFMLVHKLGAPFVQAMVPDKYMQKFRTFENSGKLNIVVFILFLIPGMPKDVFTYITPLTHMPMRTFLLLSNIGRIPSIVVSTYAAAGLVEGDILQSVIIFAVAGAIAVAGILCYDRIMKLLERLTGKDNLELRDYEGADAEAEAGEGAGASAGAEAGAGAPAEAAAAEKRR